MDFSERITNSKKSVKYMVKLQFLRKKKVREVCKVLDFLQTFKEENIPKQNNLNNEEVLTKTIKKVIKQIEKTKLKSINTHCLLD